MSFVACATNSPRRAVDGLRVPKLAIFDLDGTLVDSVPDIVVALNTALSDLGLPPISAMQARCWVGNGARVLARRAYTRDMLASADDAVVDQLYKRFLARYSERACEQSRIYPGVEQCIEFLAVNGCQLACVTNKPYSITTQVLRTLKLDGWFSMVVGGDSLPEKKPHPLPLQHVMRAIGAEPPETLMIGDSASDVEAARAAGVDSLCVTYGYNQGLDVTALGANRVVDSLAEMPAFFQPSLEKTGKA